MKIEIYGQNDPSKGYLVHSMGKRLSPYGSAGMFRFDWSEEDIEKLLTPKQYTEFVDKFLFDIPTWKVNILLGKQQAKNKEQLDFISQW